MTKKKKKESMIEDLKPAMAVGGISMGSAVVGGYLGGALPAGVANPLTTIGTSATPFISPMVTLGAMSMITKQILRKEGLKDSIKKLAKESRF